MWGFFDYSQESRSGQQTRVLGIDGPAAPRNYLLLTQSVKTEFDPTGIPQEGLEWTAREDHV